MFSRAKPRDLRRSSRTPTRPHHPSPPSCRTPIRYPWLGAGCGAAASQGPARCGRPLGALTPPWVPASAGKTKVGAHGFRAAFAWKTTTGSSRLAGLRSGTHGWARVRGCPFPRTGSTWTAPVALTPPWLPVFTGKTKVGAHWFRAAFAGKKTTGSSRSAGSEPVPTPKPRYSRAPFAVILERSEESPACAPPHRLPP